MERHCIQISCPINFIDCISIVVTVMEHSDFLNVGISLAHTARRSPF